MTKQINKEKRIHHCVLVNRTELRECWCSFSKIFVHFQHKQISLFMMVLESSCWALLIGNPPPGSIGKVYKKLLSRKVPIAEADMPLVS